MNRSKSVLQITIPLAGLTGLGLLATDLYLPAIPLLPESLGGTVAQGQLTLASFMAALALSQILWGWASDKFGEGLILKIGSGLLVLGSAACALTPNIEVLILSRAIQGLGAGAATAVVPALLRKTFEEADAVRAISYVGMAEAVVPALAPIVGAFLISFTSWRNGFWVIALVALALLPLVTRVTRGLSRTENKDSLIANIIWLLKDRQFIKFALSYACLFSALLVFVSSAPYLVSHIFNLPVGYFSLLQVLGVSAFMATAVTVGDKVEKIGMKTVLFRGAVLHILSAVLFLAFGFMKETPPYYTLLIVWIPFGLGMGFRGPAIFAKSLGTAGSRAGQASGLLNFLAFGLSGAATAAVSPFLTTGMLPVAIAVAILSVASIALSHNA